MMENQMKMMSSDRKNFKIKEIKIELDEMEPHEEKYSGYCESNSN